MLHIISIHFTLHSKNKAWLSWVGTTLMEGSNIGINANIQKKIILISAINLSLVLLFIWNHYHANLLDHSRCTCCRFRKLFIESVLRILTVAMSLSYGHLAASDRIPLGSSSQEKKSLLKHKEKSIKISHFRLDSHRRYYNATGPSKLQTFKTLNWFDSFQQIIIHISKCE